MASVWDDIVNLDGYLDPFWNSDLISWYHPGGDAGSHTHHLPVQSKETKQALLPQDIYSYEIKSCVK